MADSSSDVTAIVTIADQTFAPVSIGQLESWWHHDWMTESLPTIDRGLNQLWDLREALLAGYELHELSLERNQIGFVLVTALWDYMQDCFEAIALPYPVVSHPVASITEV